MSSFSAHHRRNTTNTASLPTRTTGMRGNTFDAPRRGSEQQLPTWRHRRNNSNSEATSTLRTARANTLPALPVECMQAAVAAAEKAAAELVATNASTKEAKPAVRKNSAASRADKVDNWRVKPAKRTEEAVKQCSCSQVAATAATHSTHAKTASLPVLPQVLPPIRVSMEPAPVEVLPPLRFSMDPVVNGRSAWRFVLPEGGSNAAPKDADNEVSTEDLIDDLPRWFSGKESDMIVRMGNAVERADSPSARSTSSASSAYSSDDGARHDAPPLDYYGDDDDTSSASSSQTASPVLGGMRQLALYPSPIDEDTSDVKTPMAAMQHFAVPSLSAAAPLPSRLPMPSFLARNVAK